MSWPECRGLRTMRSPQKKMLNCQVSSPPFVPFHPFLLQLGLLPQSLGKCYTWWYFNEELMQYTGLEKSLLAFKKTFEEQGPFDGILGFSQGTAMAAVLCALKNQGKPENAWLNFKFAILVSGFKPRAKELAEIFSVPLDVPSLHIIGDTDVKVAPEKSVDLMTSFSAPEIYRHPGGHYVPSDPATRDAIVAFVSKYLS